MTDQPAPQQEQNTEPYAYLSADVTRNSRGYSVSVTVRTRPGESDKATLMRLRLAMAELEARYPRSE